MTSSGRDSVQDLPNSLRRVSQNRSNQGRFNFSWIGGIAQRIRGALKQRTEEEVRSIERQSEAALRETIHSFSARRSSLDDRSYDPAGESESQERLGMGSSLGKIDFQNGALYDSSTCRNSDESSREEEDTKEPVWHDPGVGYAFDLSSHDRIDDNDELDEVDEVDYEYDDMENEGDVGSEENKEPAAPSTYSLSTQLVNAGHDLDWNDEDVELDAELDLYDDENLDMQENGDYEAPTAALGEYHEMPIGAEEEAAESEYDGVYGGEHEDLEDNESNLAELVELSEREAEEYNPEMSSMSIWEENGFGSYEDPVLDEVNGKEPHLEDVGDLAENEVHGSSPVPEMSSLSENPGSTRKPIDRYLGFLFGPGNNGYSIEEQSTHQGHVVAEKPNISATTNAPNTPNQVDYTAKPENAAVKCDQDMSAPNDASNTAPASTALGVPPDAAPTNASPDASLQVKGENTSRTWNLFKIGFSVAPSSDYRNTHDKMEVDTGDDIIIANDESNAGFEEEFSILAQTAHRLISSSSLFGGAAPIPNRQHKNSLDEDRTIPHEDPETEVQRLTSAAHSLFADSPLFGGAQKRTRDDVIKEEAGTNLEETENSVQDKDTPLDNPVVQKDTQKPIEPEPVKPVRRNKKAKRNSETAEDASNQKATDSEKPVQEEPKPQRKIPERRRPVTRSMLRAMEKEKAKLADQESAPAPAEKEDVAPDQKSTPPTRKRRTRRR